MLCYVTEKYDNKVESDYSINNISIIRSILLNRLFIKVSSISSISCKFPL